MRELTDLEELFLRTDHIPTEVGHFSTLLVLDASAAPWDEVPLDAVRAHVAARLPHIESLRSRLVPHPSTPQRYGMVDGGMPDLGHHVREARLAAPGRSREIARLMGELGAAKLDRDHPLWGMWLLRGTPRDRLAVVLKVHHAVCDGQTWRDMKRRLLGPLEEVASPPLAPPERGLLAKAADAGRSGPPAPLPTPPLTRFNNPLNGDRDIAFASVDASPLHRARRAAGATVTEVMVAVVAGALREWLGARGELPAEPIVASLPASLRPPGDTLLGGNNIGLLILPLPTDEPDPMRRLAAAGTAVRSATERLASLPGISAYGPRNIGLALTSTPPVPLALCGAPLMATYTATVMSSMGLQIVFITRPGAVDVCVHVDRRQGEGGWSIVAALETAVDELDLALA